MRLEDIERALEDRRDEDCLSQLALDRAADGEETGFGPHLASCARCAGRLEAIVSARTRFPRESWIAGTAARALAAAGPRPERRPGFAGTLSRAAAFAAIAAGFAAVVLLPDPPEPGERGKGAPALFAVVKHADGRIRRVAESDALAAGDSLRFEISAPAGGFAAVVGLDAKPSVTVYAPPTGNAVAVPRGRSFLEGSIVLDETLGLERDIAVVCDRPIAIEEVVAAAEAALARAGGDPSAAGALGLPGCRESAVTFAKGPGGP